MFCVNTVDGGVKPSRNMENWTSFSSTKDIGNFLKPPYLLEAIRSRRLTVKSTHDGLLKQEKIRILSLRLSFTITMFFNV